MPVQIMSVPIVCPGADLEYSRRVLLSVSICYTPKNFPRSIPETVSIITAITKQFNNRTAFCSCNGAEGSVQRLQVVQLPLYTMITIVKFPANFTIKGETVLSQYKVHSPREKRVVETKGGWTKYPMMQCERTILSTRRSHVIHQLRWSFLL